MRLRQIVLGMIAGHPWVCFGLLSCSALLIVFEGFGMGLILLILGIDGAGTGIGKTGWLTAIRDGISGTTVFERIHWAALVLLGTAILRTALTFAQRYLAVGLRVDITARLQARMLAQLHRLPLGYLQAQRSGAWTAMLINQSREVGNVLEAAVLMPASFIATLTYLLFSWLISWQLTLLAMVPLVAILALARPWASLRLRRISHEVQRQLREVSGMVQEHIAMTRLLRAFNREAWSQENFVFAQELLKKQEFRFGMMMAMSRPLFELFGVAGFSLLILGDAYLIEGTDAERLGRIVAFLVIASRLLTPVSQIVQFLGHYARAMPSVRAIMDFNSDSVRLAMADGQQQLEDFSKGIHVDDVSFSYGVDQPPVLRNISLWIPRGRTIAIVGASGSGKSSLVNLLLRLYDPVEGSIYLDGRNLRDLEIASWRARIAVVGQEIPIFHGTIRENLRLVRSEATDAEIVEACQQAQAHEFIMALPNGYDTSLLEHGGRLSGGQRQRISLARAFLTRCEVLILDEATSELDLMTEHAILATLAHYGQDRTVVMIAHRLATVVDSDCIFVMEGGRIVEQGSHLQLLALGGLYHRMVRGQRVSDCKSAE